MAERGEFLRSISKKLEEGRGGYRPTLSPDVAWSSRGYQHRPELRRAEAEELPQMFVEELEALGGHGVRVRSFEEAREYVLSLAREVGAKLVIRWDEPYLEELGADEPLKEAGVGVSVWGEGEDAREQAARADIGLSTAEYAVAETGSLVVCSGVGAGRSVTLLPPTYVAVVPAGRVVSGVADVIRAYAGRGELPSGLCFHTGPSRSADIEQSLAIGVHGPGDVHVVLVG